MTLCTLQLISAAERCPAGAGARAGELRKAMSFFTTLIGSTALLALSSGLAAATPATLERSAKVHSGPGVKYHVVATLRRGTVVDVSGCSGSWCEVAWGSREGYVAHRLLAAGPGPAAVNIAPGPAYYVDDYPGFDYPGYAYEPSIAVAPHRYRRSGRWQGWHHRSGWPGWAGRPDSLPTGATPGVRNPERTPRLGNFAPSPTPSAGGLIAPRSTLGAGAAAANGMRGSMGADAAAAAAAASVPPVSAPAVSAPAAAAAPASSADAPARR
jgi:uncharacterized protein YraI